MLKRQKILLGILLQARRKASRTEVMKWLFLLRQETALGDEPSFYDFVPYDFGPFSFTVYRDIADLRRLGLIGSDDCTIPLDMIKSAGDAFQTLPVKAKAAVTKLIDGYGHESLDGLIDTVYARYPWFASRSKLREQDSCCNRKTETAVYTLGYEGKSIDTFLKVLLSKGVKRIIDVRRNPVSRKYGFAGSTLERLAAKLQIDYEHIPQLGVPSADRRELKTFADYQNLLDHYQRDLLPTMSAGVKAVSALVREKPSVLICYEHDVRCCHRGRLADAVSIDSGLEIVHL